MKAADKIPRDNCTFLQIQPHFYFKGAVFCMRKEVKNEKRKMKKLIDKLEKEHFLSKNEYVCLIENFENVREYAAKKARMICERVYGRDIYIRGLIEISSFCRNDCIYCGIRRSNKNAQRYRLSKEEILECCDIGYNLGFRTFVLQGGEDKFYTDEIIADIVRSIKKKYADCAVTLSLGEFPTESYALFKKAGADRYLLRHETAEKAHYEKLHPKEMSFENRMRCLRDLKNLGYQVGCGMMIGSPYQTAESLAEDMMFIQSFKPHMIGMGPFIPQHDTPFGNEKGGSVEMTLFMISLVRLALPNALIPATTALGTLDPLGREKGAEAGANVTMPNLSPVSVRKKYALYDNKICTGEEAAECLGCLMNRFGKVDRQIVFSRGDYKK